MLKASCLPYPIFWSIAWLGLFDHPSPSTSGFSPSPSRACAVWTINVFLSLLGSRRPYPWKNIDIKLMMIIIIIYFENVHYFYAQLGWDVWSLSTYRWTLPSQVPNQAISCHHLHNTQSLQVFLPLPPGTYTKERNAGGGEYHFRHQRRRRLEWNQSIAAALT